MLMNLSLSARPLGLALTWRFRATSERNSILVAIILHLSVNALHYCEAGLKSAQCQVGREWGQPGTDGDEHSDWLLRPRTVLVQRLGGILWDFHDTENGRYCEYGEKGNIM